MNILAIGAHPDDIECGCGATLLNYGANGHKLFLLVMTGGVMGGDADIRKKEQMNSAKIMNVEEVIFGGFEDTLLTSNKELIELIENTMKKVKPDLIFANYFNDTHQDHRNLTQGVLSATRYAKNVLFYEGPTTQNFDPTVFSDIKDSLDKKVECLKAHKSQVKKTNIEGLSIIEIAKSTSVFRGIQARVKYAEGFVPLRLFLKA